MSPPAVEICNSLNYCLKIYFDQFLNEDVRVYKYTIVKPQ